MARFGQAVCAVSVLLLGVSGETHEEGKAFLAQNKEKEGVVTLPSGMQYKIIRSGEGEYHPKGNSQCAYKYKGYTSQEWARPNHGIPFHVSDERQPEVHSPNKLITGWREVIPMMVVGDQFELYIPSELGYGDKGYEPQVSGGDVLVFAMEMIDIIGEKTPVRGDRCQVATPNDGCTDRMRAFIAEHKGKSADQLKLELKQIEDQLGTISVSDNVNSLNEAVPDAVGVYRRVHETPAPQNANRPIYQNDKGLYLFYWSSEGSDDEAKVTRWLIGTEYTKYAAFVQAREAELDAVRSTLWAFRHEGTWYDEEIMVTHQEADGSAMEEEKKAWLYVRANLLTKMMDALKKKDEL